jgi:manganese/zinc/iron transport system permease protein
MTFDAEFAGANGFRIGLINTLLSTLIVVTIVLGLQLAGVILMVGMLIAPGVAARQWTHKLNQMVILAAVFGAFSGGVGAVISALDSDIPTGPMIIVVAFVLVLVSLALAPGRGLLWSRLRGRANRRRFAARNTLRDLYRYALAHGAANSPVPDAFIRGVGDRSAELGLRQLRADGHATPGAAGWQLSASGVELAQRDARNRQLWDLYRRYAHELDLPIVAEERQLDIASVLPPAAAAELESRLPEGAAE